MTRRIFGLETEYGVVVVPTGEQPATPSVEEAVRLMFEGVPDFYELTNHFLTNGSRLYVDIGAHPEYAGPECDRIDDAVAADLAGDAWVSRLAAGANATLRERGVEARIHVLRNNTDAVGNTFGCHENYQVSRETDFDALTLALTAFLVSRPILTGCGHLDIGPDGRTRYTFSTRAAHMAATTSADPTRARPLLTTKDEPHADPSRWRRLHVLSGDSNVAQTATALKLGWTGLVLDLVESAATHSASGGDDGQAVRAAIEGLVPVDPMAAMREFNVDLTGQAAVPTRGGARLRAVDIQEGFLELVRRDGDRRPRSGGSGDLGTVACADPIDSAWVLDLVETGLEAVRSGRHEAVRDRLDWAMKHHLLGEYARARGLDLADPRVARLAFAYHDIDPVTGLGHALHQHGHLARFVSPEQVATARDTPPQTTRARLRGDFVAWVAERGFHASVDWAQVRLNRPIGRPVELPDPFASANAQVEALKTAYSGPQEDHGDGPRESHGD